MNAALWLIYVCASSAVIIIGVCVLILREPTRRKTARPSQPPKRSPVPPSREKENP